MDSKLSIRIAQLTDESELFKLRNSPEIYKWFINSNMINLEEHKKWLMDRVENWPKFTFVAIENNYLVGLCYLKIIAEMKYEISIHVMPNLQNTGIGSNLISEMIKSSRKYGVTAIFARINRENLRSLNFFKKHGFVEYYYQVNEFLVNKNFATFQLQL